ncbi:MAG: hypothetical protein HW375_1, partial [Anaerolineales bacterium]|nr:hypothetical protein [Anaerolineales bacterium]
MPTAPVGPCRTARCSGRGVRGGYCRSCQAEYERSRKGTKALYSSAGWRRVRAAYLSAHPFCECGDRATQVDHVKAVKDGGARFDWSNLQS